MSDLLERLAAANPVPESERPPIDTVWRKIAELEAESGSIPRVSSDGRPRRIRRLTLTLAAVVVPVAVVLALAIPLLGARHGTTGPTPSGKSSAQPALDPAAQGAAALGLAGRAGSVVALDPRTGAIKAMYANTSQGGGPAFTGPAAALEFPPGATFDIVTTAAAIDTGRYAPGSRIAGPSPLSVSGTPLRNEGDQSFGRITLTESLRYSVDTVFAQVGEAVGRRSMTTYMRRFGFYASPRLDSASARLAASGVRLGDALVLPSSARVDLGRLAVGQGQLAATPLQMAMVAAAVADRGKLMAPHLEPGRSIPYNQVMAPSTAQALAQMMRDVVERGTGTAAGLSRLQVAGKTGTVHAGNPRSKRTDAWFIGFAPANNPRIAIAVVLSGVNGGFGGTDAAPIAAKVIEKLLGRPPRP